MSRSTYVSAPRHQRDRQSFDLYDRSSALLHKNKWVMYGTEESDYMNLFDVEHTVSQPPGSETNGFVYYAGAGDDKVRGGTENDRIYGQHGNDGLDGGTGDDYLSGGYGNDTLRGHAGSDTLIGGHGNDVIYAGEHWGADLIILDGQGFDYVHNIGYRKALNHVFSPMAGDQILINKSNWTSAIVGRDIVIMDNQLNPFAVIYHNSSSMVQLEQRPDGFIVVGESSVSQAQYSGFSIMN